MRRIATIGGLLILAACNLGGPLSEEEIAASRPHPTWPPASMTGPCADTAYVRMKRVPVDSLSSREFEIFKVRDAACVQHMSTASRDAAIERAADTQSNATGVWLGLLAVSSLVGLVLLVAH
jgi:hypothetical protein